MTASLPSDPVVSSGRSPCSAALAVVLGTALMVAAPLAMGIAAMQEGGGARSTAGQLTWTHTTAASAFDRFRSFGDGDQGGEPGTVVISPGSFTLPITLW